LHSICRRKDRSENYSSTGYPARKSLDPNANCNANITQNGTVKLSKWPANRPSKRQLELPITQTNTSTSKRARKLREEPGVQCSGISDDPSSSASDTDEADNYVHSQTRSRGQAARILTQHTPKPKHAIDQSEGLSLVGSESFALVAQTSAIGTGRPSRLADRLGIQESQQSSNKIAADQGTDAVGGGSSTPFPATVYGLSTSGKVESFNARLKQLADDYAALETENSSLTSTKAALSAEVTALKEENSALRVSDLEESIAMMKSKLAALASELAVSKDEKSLLAAQIGDMEATIKRKQAVIDKLAA